MDYITKQTTDHIYKGRRNAINESSIFGRTQYQSSDHELSRICEEDGPLENICFGHNLTANEDIYGQKSEVNRQVSNIKKINNSSLT